MGRLRSGRLLCAAVAISLLGLGNCGGNKPPGPNPFVARITLSPPTSQSLQVGSVMGFTATAQNGSGSNVNPGFTFQSSDTSILNFGPGGAACAGNWNAPLFTVCTPANSGVVQVTATALGATSAPTLVFVHPPIDNISIQEVPQNSPPPACPGPQNIPAACAVVFSSNTQCLSQNQTKILQATAFSKGADITAVVGPFTWSEGSSSVVKVTPTTSSAENVPTNQATVTPNAPGFTPVFATASGVSSQPYYAETCPVQCIALELGPAGPQNSNQTSFSTTKGKAQTASATAVDVQGCVVPKPPLTWSSSDPASVSAPASCSGNSTCSISTASPGSGTVTAACTPPTCNIGFPKSVAGLPQPLVQPFPVYPVTAISGLVTGAASSTSVLATSLDCATVPLCNVNIYNVSTSTNLAGNPATLPTAPNSLLFDLAGDKAYMGSQFGAQLITPANLGTTGNAFAALGTVTGKILAVSPNGSSAVFSDTLHTPNQVYVVNASSPSSTVITALNISGAVAATFSPDSVKALIIGCATTNPGVPCNSSPGSLLTGNALYIYSTLQALQTISFSVPMNAVVFSSSGTFALVSGGSASSVSAITVNTCDNSSKPLSMTNLPAPIFLKMVPPGSIPVSGLQPLGLDFFIGLDNTGIDFIATTATQPPFPQQCSQTVGPAQTMQQPPTTFVPQHIDIHEGTFHPINFFLSPDATQAFIVASEFGGVLIYDFNTGAVSRIPLVPNVIPISASMTVDGSLIYVVGSDGTLHEVSTTLATDLLQIPFPTVSTLSNNAFCSSTPPNGVPCNLNFTAVKP